MAAQRTLKTLELNCQKFLSSYFRSLKSACTDIIGTNRKPDVMRVLRTQGLLDYNNSGTGHEILDAGHRYFVTDSTRRNSDDKPVQFTKLPDIWKEKPGTEVFIRGRNALELKRDYFDSRMMALIDPPAPSRRRGLAAAQLLATMDSLDELPDAVDEDIPVGEQVVAGDPWMDAAVKMASQGNEAGGRALAYLTRKRTLALLNETAQRAGVVFTSGVDLEDHLHRFCSFRMRLQLADGEIFTSDAQLRSYLEMIPETTAESLLGYSPELVG